MRLPLPSALRALPAPLRAFTLTNLALTAACWLLVLPARRFGWGLPWAWPLFSSTNHFYDFVAYHRPLSILRHTPGSPPGVTFAYFPPGIFLYLPFDPFTRTTGYLLFLLLVGLLVLFAAVAFARALQRRGLAPGPARLYVALAVLCSFPALFCLQRGNFEILLALGILAGLWAFRTGRNTLAATLWGLFSSVKLYPLTFAALFLARRRPRFFFLTLAVTALAELLALAFIGPTVTAAWHTSRQGTSSFVSTQTTLATRSAASVEGLSWDHSLFNLVKLPLSHLTGRSVGSLLGLYLPAAAALALLLYLVRVRRLPLLNQLTLCAIAAVLLPPTSYSYTLLYLYAPWAMLSLDAIQPLPAEPTPAFPRPAPARPRPTPPFILLGALVSPFSFLALHHADAEGYEKSLLLLALLILTTLKPWPAPAATLRG